MIITILLYLGVIKANKILYSVFLKKNMFGLRVLVYDSQFLSAQ